jgi:hypothetical protein
LHASLRVAFEVGLWDRVSAEVDEIKEGTTMADEKPPDVKRSRKSNDLPTAADVGTEDPMGGESMSDNQPAGEKPPQLAASAAAKVSLIERMYFRRALNTHRR